MEEANETWTKPKRIIKLKKSSTLTGRPKPNNTLPILPSFSSNEAVKRRNPFASSDENGDPGAFASVSKRAKLCASFSSGHHGVLADKEDSGLGLSNNSHEDEEDVEEKKIRLPIDWSLKSRARFSSPHPLGWSQSLSTVEEASGVTAGVRCLNLTSGSHCLDQSTNAEFHAACLYWQHPALPGTTLFPRFTVSNFQKQSSNLTISPDMARALHSDWQSSLSSIYQLVKARQCPYFYVCGSSFTCLFRAAGISGSQQICALLSPTTSGLRASLKREDIEFSLPLFKPKENDENKEPENDEAKDWLESLGVSSDSLPGLSNPNPKARPASTNNPDNRPDSTVYVEGVECQSLMNYLLNAKLTSGNTAAQAGLPPTLLAPIAFHGATLRSLKVRQAVVGGIAGKEKHHVVELSGPILPHTLPLLCHLAAKRRNSPAGFSVTLLPLEDTACFSMFKLPKEAVALSVFANTNLKDCGLRGDILENFCAAPVEDEDEGCVLRDVKMEKGGYSWNTESEITF